MAILTQTIQLGEKITLDNGTTITIVANHENAVLVDIITPEPRQTPVFSHAIKKFEHFMTLEEEVAKETARLSANNFHEYKRIYKEV